MSVELLDKTRKINKLLHNNNSHKVVFNDICKVLSEILLSNILVISKKGKVLGVSICPGVDEIHELIEDKVGGYVDKMFNERLLSVLSTKENVNLATLGFAEENVKKYQAIIAPIDIAGERLGTLFMYKSDEQYDIDDIILCEYGTTVVGLEMMRSVNEENAEETRKVQIVKSAISTLSFSELEAITHIFEELDGNEGILVASKIADRVGITRSVIVNALRKFESAGVIESRSSGMKGTYIKVLNDVVFDELKALKALNKELEEEVDEEIKILPVWQCIVYIIGGAVAIKFGGDFVVDGASTIATGFGISQNLIGLTIVALGTSLPELVTSIVAAKKNEVDMALGNVIGSNIFNILLVLGVAGAISPVAFVTENLIDIAILVVMSVVVWIFAWSKKKLVNWHGAVMLVSYVAYLVYICIR